MAIQISSVFATLVNFFLIDTYMESPSLFKDADNALGTPCIWYYGIGCLCETGHTLQELLRVYWGNQLLFNLYFLKIESYYLSRRHFFWTSPNFLDVYYPKKSAFDEHQLVNTGTVVILYVAVGKLFFSGGHGLCMSVWINWMLLFIGGLWILSRFLSI